MFSLVTKEVRLITKNKQRPYKYASLESIVCLTGNCSGAAPASGAIDAVQDAKVSESEEVQIALQTKNSAALEAYLQKYPDSPKRTVVLDAISSLRRSEFNEWTLFEVVGNKFPLFMQISSIQQFGSRVAVRHKFTADPSKPFVPGKDFPDAAYADIVAVVDCEQPLTAMAEQTVISKSGEILHHYKWADPRYLNLSIGVSINPNTAFATERKIVCHDKIRTPLLGRKQVAAMNFASLSSTVAGDGDIFYAPIDDEKGRDDVREVLLIFRMHKDTSFVFPGSTIDTTVLPQYRIEVDHVKLKCFGDSFTLVRSNYFDASFNLVHLAGTDPSSDLNWKDFPELSPYRTLQRIMCPSNFVGLGIQVAKDGSSVKVVKVFEETPAQKGGVKVNDIITHLDDETVDGLTLDQVTEKMRGRLNTEIKIRVAREGQPIELSVARGVIRRSSVQAPAVQAPSVQWAPSTQWPPVQTPSVQWPSVQTQVQQ
jgi:hypothetical protein